MLTVLCWTPLTVERAVARKTSGRTGGRPVHFIVVGDDLAIITESRITVVDLKCRLPDDMTPKAEAGLEAIAEHA